MSRLYFKYYTDTIKFNLLFCVICLIVKFDTTGFLVNLATFGTLVSFFAYSYFHKVEYNFYLNRGFTKSRLHLQTFIINLCLSLIIATSVWIISFR